MVVNVKLKNEELEKLYSEKKLTLTINLSLKEEKEDPLKHFRKIGKEKTRINKAI